jgi:hypothetical protein
MIRLLASKVSIVSGFVLFFSFGMANAQVPAAPVLTAPADEASRIQAALFSWNPVAEAATYHLQVATAYNFSALVVNDSTLTTTSFQSGSLNLRTVHFWRVRSKNANGVSAWSTIYSFTTLVPLPEPDSAGWIRLFRGNNASDFFAAPNNSTPPGRTLGAFPASPYSVTGDTIRVTGNPAGQFYFKQPFSHYKIRYQMRFPNFTNGGTNGNTGTGNCGMLLHVQAQDPTTNGFPRSVESQGDPTQGMGQLWPIGDVWVTTTGRTVSGRMQYDSAGPEVVYGALNWNSRVIVGQNGWAQPTFASQQQDGWVTQEAHVYGNDSIIHLVNGVPRIKYRNPRVSPGGTPNNVTKLLSRGLLAWQSEGTSVWYRNIEIQLLPGDSLYTPVSITPGARKSSASKSAAPRMNLDNAAPAAIVPTATGGTRLYDMRGRAMSLTENPATNRAAPDPYQQEK